MDFGGGFVAMHSLRSGRVHVAAVTLAFSAFTIDGGASVLAAETSKEAARQVEPVSAIGEPDPTLFRRQAEPVCAFRGPVSNPMTAEETRQKLDYEQQCYRSSEAIVRARLDALQDSARKMTKSLPDPTLLRRQAEPACAFRGPVSNPMTAEETRQKLDYEQQCFRASEAIVRARLGELQDSVQKMTKSRNATVTPRSNAVTSRSYKGISCSTAVRQLLKFLERKLAKLDSEIQGIR